MPPRFRGSRRTKQVHQTNVVIKRGNIGNPAQKGGGSLMGIQWFEAKEGGIDFGSPIGCAGLC